MHSRRSVPSVVRSLTEEVLPALCETVIVTPASKSGSRYDPLNQGWANSALSGIFGSETVSLAHVVDSFLSLLLRVTILFWRYVIIKCKQRIFILT